MPIRIYALAKELKIDSKELVDVCNKAGVTGKGSALASLSDEEVAKVRTHLSGGPSKSPDTATATAPVRAGTPAGDGAASTFTRDDYIAPGGTTAKPPVIAPKTSKPAAEKRKEDEKRKETQDEGPGTKGPVKKEPVVKLAAIPKTKQPTPPPKPAEPTPQKPIMTLPPDAIRGAKSGAKAPLEQFTRQTEKRRTVTSKKPPAVPKPGEKAPVTRRGGRDHGRGKGPGEPEEKRRLAGMASARAARQQKRRTSRPGFEYEGEGRRPRRRLTRKGTNTAAPRKGKLVLQLPCSVRSFSEATGVPTSNIQRTLMGLGTMATITAQLDADMAELLAAELGLDVEIKLAESLEDTLLAGFVEPEEDAGKLQTRPPIVTFLGHVDHGKTSLLDKIIGIDVVSGEAGGITQHIRAYKIGKNGREVSFVDTPGHEAFTEMRTRGANVTDIAVLVIAADDGIMPQTEEAISHAKAAEVPIVVALNKCDLPGADTERVMQQLSTHELLPSEWGGEIEVIKTSALTGEGLDDLLETLLLTADLHEYQANPDRAAHGTCLEAQQEGDRGVVAKLVVRNGTLHVGDVLVCGDAYGRIKAMYDPLHPSRKLDDAGPSTPVNATGLDVAPEAGEAFYVLDDIAQARQIAEQREHRSRERSLSGKSTRISFEEFQRRLEEGVLAGGDEPATLNLILRADVRGSIEAIQKELGKLEHPEVRVNILQATVGGITVADVTLGDASDAVILGFNVIPDEAARALADERGVEIRRYNIIYKLTEEIKALLEGKLKPEQRVQELGRALVQHVFTISRVGTVAGCRVLAGTIERGCRVRVNREGRGIGEYPLESLRREKDDAREVREGFECGMKLAGFNDLKEGDLLEAYKIEEVARTL